MLIVVLEANFVSATQSHFLSNSFLSNTFMKKKWDPCIYKQPDTLGMSTYE